MKRILMAAAFAMGLATPVAAQEMINASNALDVVGAVRDLGYRAVLEKDSVDDPMISSKASGLNFVILFYGCTDHQNCQSIQLSTSFTLSEPLPDDAMNRWNSENRYGRAYLDDENDPILRYEINMTGAGISREVFDDNIDIWESLLSDFKEHIDF
jgi:hypothetical protein